MSTKAQRPMTAAAACAAVALLFTCSAAANAGIIDGLCLCAEVVIPSLFPFMVIAGFIARSSAAQTISRPLSAIMSPLFAIPRDACCAVMLSFISGYPVGAAGIAQLEARGIIDCSAASRMLAFSVNAGPAMIVLAVGRGMLGNERLGWLLYGTHICASIIIGAVSARFAKPCASSLPSAAAYCEPPAEAFVNSTAAACSQMLTICGWVTLFAAITKLLDGAAQWAIPLAEVTCGARWAVGAGLSVPVISAILGFSGVSVICQVLSLSKGLIRPLRLIAARVVHAAISFLLCSVMIRLLPDSIATMSNCTDAVASGFTVMTVPVTLSMLLSSAALLCFTGRKS